MCKHMNGTVKYLSEMLYVMLHLDIVFYKSCFRSIFATTNLNRKSKALLDPFNQT